MARLRVLCAILLLVGVVLAQDWQNGPLQPTGFRLTRLDGEYFPLNYSGGDTGMVYFLGGRLASAATDSSIWRFNPRTGAYTDMGVDMPIAVSNYDIVLLRDNWNLAAGDTYGLYIVGGRGSTGLNQTAVQVYYPRSNTVRVVATDLADRTPVVLAGGAGVVMEVLGRPFRVQAGSFFQVNTAMAGSLVQHVLDGLRQVHALGPHADHCGHGESVGHCVAPDGSRPVRIRPDDD